MMTKNTILYFLVTVAMLWLLPSCTKEQTYPSQAASANSIEFGLSKVGTKGLDISNKNVSSYGVIGGNSPEGDFSASTVCDYIQDGMISRDTLTAYPLTFGSWYSTPKYYWPLSGKISFFAYLPHSSRMKEGCAVVPSPNYVQGFPLISYSPDPTVKKQSDFCVAAPVMNRIYLPSPNDTVRFNFTHALTKVSFQCTCSGLTGIGKAYVREISICNVISRKDLIFDVSGYQWEDDATATETGTYYFSQKNSDLVSDAFTASMTSPVVLNTNTGYAYLLPQRVNSSRFFQVSFEVTNSGDNDGYYIKNVGMSDLEWQKGQQVRYSLEISVSDVIKLTMDTDIVPWNDSGNTHPEQEFEY